MAFSGLRKRIGPWPKSPTHPLFTSLHHSLQSFSFTRLAARGGLRQTVAVPLAAAPHAALQKVAAGQKNGQFLLHQHFAASASPTPRTDCRCGRHHLLFIYVRRPRSGWTSAVPSIRLVIVDSAEANIRLKLQHTDRHGLLNTVAVAVLALRKHWPMLRNALILEADYRWARDDWSESRARAAVDNVAKFVRRGRWQYLRLGYVPVGDSHGAPPDKADRMGVAEAFALPNTACPAVCACEPVHAGVCEIRHAPQPSSYCDVRSMVSYMVSGSAFDTIVWWRNQTLQRAAHAARFGYYNDKWMPYAISPIHYAVPGLLTDSTPAPWKQQFVPRMDTFASKCVTNGSTAHHHHNGHHNATRAAMGLGMLPSAACAGVACRMDQLRTRAMERMHYLVRGRRLHAFSGLFHRFGWGRRRQVATAAAAPSHEKGGVAVLLLGQMPATGQRHLGRLRSQLAGSHVYAATYPEYAALAADVLGNSSSVLMLTRREVEEACTVHGRMQQGLLQWYQLRRLITWIGHTELQACCRLIVKTRFDLALLDPRFTYSRLPSIPPTDPPSIAALSDLIVYATPKSFLQAYSGFFDAAVASYVAQPSRDECTRRGEDAASGFAPMKPCEACRLVQGGCRIGGSASCPTWGFGHSANRLQQQRNEKNIARKGAFASELAHGYHVLLAQHLRCVPAEALGKVAKLRGGDVPSNAAGCSGSSCLGTKWHANL